MEREGPKREQDIQARIQDFEMGGEFLLQCNRTNQYLRDKKRKKRKKGAQKGGEGGENSPISPSLEPRLDIFFCLNKSRVRASTSVFVSPSLDLSFT